MAAHVVWYACKYAPIELLAGLGAECRPVEHEAESFEEAERVAHGNLCGYAKSLIDAAGRPEVRELVLTTCCDAMRRAFDVLLAEGELDYIWLLDLPHKNGTAERARMSAELTRLAESYGAYAGTEFDLARALAAVVAEPAAAVEGTVALMGAHATTSLLAETSRVLGDRVTNHTCTGPRTLAAPPRALARPTSAGCGACPTDAASDLERFVSWYAGALLDQTPCMRMHDADGRGGIPAGSPGAIYHTMKFCDYYGFEYSDLAGHAGVPLLKLETDGTRQSAGQLRTRIEAFAETVGLGRDATMTTAISAAPAGPTYVLGLDSGSTSTDAVVVDGSGSVVASVIVATGAKATASAERACAEVLELAGLSDSDLALRVATGYGRDAIPHMDATITEITCHARGARELAPGVRTIVDIGGQDSKVIHLDASGEVDGFVMNDKCAAGTGRFLETMARTLEMSLPEFCERGLEWRHEVSISSMCTVFAESEVVSLVADDTPTADVIHGLDLSVARKTAALARRVSAEPPYLMTGGVAQNAGVVAALATTLGADVATHPDSQLCGALGAALLGLERLGSAK